MLSVSDAWPRTLLQVLWRALHMDAFWQQLAQRGQLSPHVLFQAQEAISTDARVQAVLLTFLYAVTDATLDWDLDRREFGKFLTSMLQAELGRVTDNRGKSWRAVPTSLWRSVGAALGIVADQSLVMTSVYTVGNAARRIELQQSISTSVQVAPPHAASSSGHLAAETTAQVSAVSRAAKRPAVSGEESKAKVAVHVFALWCGSCCACCANPQLVDTASGNLAAA